MVEAVRVPQQTFLVSGILQEKADMTLRISRREGSADTFIGTGY